MPSRDRPDARAHSDREGILRLGSHRFPASTMEDMCASPACRPSRGGSTCEKQHEHQEAAAAAIAAKEAAQLAEREAQEREAQECEEMVRRQQEWREFQSKWVALQKAESRKELLRAWMRAGSLRLLRPQACGVGLCSGHGALLCDARAWLACVHKCRRSRCVSNARTSWSLQPVRPAPSVSSTVRCETQLSDAVSAE